ncbi:response regulator transcription factor [Dictyobacter kobayashii]|uniref:DNA-binding response regulator n=1 Tax=Dictyobacter kobayashii TaxID=2014872 RepID=A0A402AKW7_9CHLR|nr:response regulator transcription factor [Dictyobacter kobayashii]GCE19767.1 DNA-binding response regulator [Dictyobacter kobayashii]
MSKRKMSILVVEDEIEIIRTLQRSLSAHNYEVISANSGEQALTLLEREKPDLLLLDLGLPGMNGLEVCRRIRMNSHLPPIIVITVKNKESDKVRALDLGADDYISKPFGINEVLARIRVALRHASFMPEKIEQALTIGPLQIDFTQRLVCLEGKELKLTPTEYDLLRVLLEYRGKILTQTMLLTKVWGNDYSKQSHYVHVYINHLRRKIEADPAHPRFLETITGVGYRFNDEELEG